MGMSKEYVEDMITHRIGRKEPIYVMDEDDEFGIYRWEIEFQEQFKLGMRQVALAYDYISKTPEFHTYLETSSSQMTGSGKVGNSSSSSGTTTSDSEYRNNNSGKNTSNSNNSSESSGSDSSENTSTNNSKSTTTGNNSSSNTNTSTSKDKGVNVLEEFAIDTLGLENDAIKNPKNRNSTKTDSESKSSANTNGESSSTSDSSGGSNSISSGTNSNASSSTGNTIDTSEGQSTNTGNVVNTSESQGNNTQDSSQRQDTESEVKRFDRPMWELVNDYLSMEIQSPWELLYKRIDCYVIDIWEVC